MQNNLKPISQEQYNKLAQFLKDEKIVLNPVIQLFQEKTEEEKKKQSEEVTPEIVK